MRLRQGTWLKRGIEAMHVGVCCLHYNGKNVSDEKPGKRDLQVSGFKDL